MLAKEVLSERYVTTPEVKEILAKRSEADDLRYEQRTALEYATRFSRTPGDEAKKIVEKLLKEIDGLKEHQAVLIVNLLPVDKDDLELIFAKERIRLDDSKIDRTLEIANEASLIDLSKIESEIEKARLAEKEAREAEEAEKEAEEAEKEAEEAEKEAEEAEKEAEEAETEETEDQPEKADDSE